MIPPPWRSSLRMRLLTTLETLKSLSSSEPRFHITTVLPCFSSTLAAKGESLP